LTRGEKKREVTEGKKSIQEKFLNRGDSEGGKSPRFTGSLPFWGLNRSSPKTPRQEKKKNPAAPLPLSR